MRQTEMIRWPLWSNFENLLGGWGAYRVDEKADQVIVEVDLPGARREDIALSAADGGLQISAERNSEQLRRHIALPDINPETIEASLQNGVLEICAKRGNGQREIEIRT